MLEVLQEVQELGLPEQVWHELSHPTQLKLIKKLLGSRQERHWVRLEQVLQGLTHEEQIESPVFW